MKDFRDLQVWHKAHSLTLACYGITSTFPRQEVNGLTSQIHRCAASAAANIAEGCGKRGNGEFYRFLNMALGSTSELEYHFLLAHDLQFLAKKITKTSITELSRLNECLRLWCAKSKPIAARAEC
jgi:four helix bundle protein